MSGIEAAVAISRKLPRLPVVFYSIQDDDDYYLAFHRWASSPTGAILVSRTTFC